MRATVIGVAVASLVAGWNAAAQSADSATSVVRQGSTQAGTAAVDTLRFGGRLIATGDSVSGPVLTVAGDLRVRGTIDGTAITIAGDIIVEQNGRITGDAIAALGTVRLDGGVVQGHQRSYAGASFGWDRNEGRAAADVRRDTGGALSLAIGWFVVVLVIGIGVLVFAGSYLEGVTDVLEQSFWRSFLVGVVGELSLVPALVLLLIGLAVTIVGILLIPFAVVAFVIAVAGLFTLGFLAAARLTGNGIGRGSTRLTTRGASLQGLVLGVVLFMGLWVLAAALQWSTMASGLVRGIAWAITYVAATAGFGAAILSRGGTRRDVARVAPQPVDDSASWQTPTPVTGVVAARRPTPAVPSERI